MTVKTALVHSDQWARFDYGPEHPLRMERLGLTWRLMEAYGLTALAGSAVRSPEPAEEAALLTFHTEEYLNVLKAANTGAASAAVVCRYGLGPGDNPIFPGLWDAARLAAGGSLLAARLVAGGEVTRAFHFAGGLHHAMPDRASGFCYVNDAVLAILHLRARGLRVAYVDIDAHHGDGVQNAFYADRNGEVGIDLAVRTKPDVIVMQLGIDSHRTDPLTHLALDVQGFARAVARITEFAPRVVALGGGGYDIGNVARAWTAAWAVMNGVEVNADLPADFVDYARRLHLRMGSLWDPPARRYGRVFVGTPHQARGRSFRIVFVPGLAERVVPQRPREDPLLLDDRRRDIDADLLRQDDRRRGS